MASRTGFAGGYQSLGWRYWASTNVGCLRPGLYILRSKAGDLVVVAIEWKEYVTRPGNYLAVVSDDGSWEVKTRQDVELASGLGDSIEMWYGPVQLPAGYLRERFFQKKQEGLQNDPKLQGRGP